MGDCYSVDMRIKVAKGSKAGLADHMRRWMKRVEPRTDASPGVNWSWAMNRAHGARPCSMMGIARIILVAHQGGFSHTVDEYGYDVYRSCFNASYGWAGVIRDAFREMSRWIADGSSLYISRDEGVDELEVKEGRIWQEEDPDKREVPCAPAKRGGRKAATGGRTRSAAR